MRRAAYTMLELITVIAITAVLLTIIIVPIFQSFSFAHSAQSFADAQVHAKQIADQIASEVSASAGIRDTTGTNGSMVIGLPSADGNPNFAPATISYAKLDILKPAQGSEAVDNNGNPIPGAYVNPAIGRTDPTLQAPMGDPSLPLAPGQSIVRYALCLRDPTQPYNNPHDTGIMGTYYSSGSHVIKSRDQDNLVVLRRFEVPVYVIVKDAGPPVSYHAIVNKMAFIDLSRLSAAHRAALKINATSGPYFDDPYFLEPKHSGDSTNWADTSHPNVAYDYAPPSYDTTTDPTKAQMITYWLQHSTVVTESARYDMLQFATSGQNHAIVYDPLTSGGSSIVPRVTPLVQFRPGRATPGSEPAEGQTAVRLGEEQENASLMASDVYKTQKGLWANETVRVYPQGWSPPNVSTTTDPNGQYRYLVCRKDPLGYAPGLAVFSYDPVTDGSDETSDGFEVFDEAAYGNGVGQYPFSYAMAQANTANPAREWQSSTYAAAIRSTFRGIVPYPEEGKIVSSFSISEVGTPTALSASPETTIPGSTPPANIISGNLPSSVIADTYTPDADPNFASYPYAPTANGAAYDINGCFNRVWEQEAGLRPDVQRFMDLRVTPQSDLQPSPLNPISGFAQAYIVPGTEEVIGPDQNPGPHYGNPTRYVRVTQNPGPNQYLINYTQKPQPQYVSALGLPNAPVVPYDPTDFVTAVIQPRYMPGYIQFESDPGTPLPAGTITVSYRFQFSMPQDVVAVDYDTRSMMNVLITVKNYAQSNLAPNQTETVTVSSSANVRYVAR
jgi:type II secretory pathway pseudopilin PulG